MASLNDILTIDTISRFLVSLEAAFLAPKTVGFHPFIYLSSYIHIYKEKVVAAEINETMCQLFTKIGLRFFHGLAVSFFFRRRMRGTVRT